MREAIYKGATRPALKFGVPLPALVGVFMPALVLAAWLGTLVHAGWAVVILAALVPLYAWMRWTTRRDDQRLHQMALRWQLQRLNRNRTLWRGARSYSAHGAFQPGASRGPR